MIDPKKKPLTADELARIEKAQKKREANKVGKNDTGASTVRK